jgi:CheY-like chemotaxis protein
MTKPIDRDRLAALLKKYRSREAGHAILVIEDDAPTRQLMRRSLEKEGWTVTEAENGRRALACVAASRPSLILLDIMMPEMDGFEFVTELRKNKEWRSIPVVVVTAKELTEEDRLRLSGRVERVIQKGCYSREKLLEEVRDRVLACAGAGLQLAAGEASSFPDLHIHPEGKNHAQTALG